LKDPKNARRAVCVVAAVVCVVVPARAQRTAFGLIQDLNARLLQSRSATTTLEDWCGEFKLASSTAIVARLAHAEEKPATPEQRRRLEAGENDVIRFRHVELRCGDRTLSDADNWYVPGRLTPEMNRALETSDTPFGTVVRPLEPYRQTFSVRFLIPPSSMPIPDAVLEHRAVLYTRDHRPFSEVHEVYRRAVLVR